MLDDSASDNSSTPPTREEPIPSLPTAPFPVGGRPQDRGPTPNLGPKNANLQQMLSISEEAEINVQQMQIVGEESNQQTSEVSIQLQVGDDHDRNPSRLPPHFLAVPQSGKISCMGTHIHS